LFYYCISFELNYQRLKRNIDRKNNYVKSNNDIFFKNGNFIYNNDPSERCGHKWRLKSLWKQLRQSGLPIEECGWIWSRIKDMVIKSILCGLTEMRKEFKKTSESRYNSYKLLGYDVMLDSALNPHLLEVNTRPSVYMEQLDEAVNQPMVQEMFRLVGYHIPADVDVDPIKKIINITQTTTNNLVFDDGVYRKILSGKDLDKQFNFDKIKVRDDWVDAITDDLCPADVRMLIKYEEEFAACEEFERIFPTNRTHEYFIYFKEVSYFDKLLDGIEYFCENNFGQRDKIIQEVRFSCLQHFEEGFGDTNVSRREKKKIDMNGVDKKELFRRSCTNMNDLRKQLDKMGGFATLRKNKTTEKENLCNKLDANRISIRIQDPISSKEGGLLRYDTMDSKLFNESLSSRKIRLPKVKADFLHTILTGDFTLGSLEPKTLFFKLDKFCKSGFRSYSEDFDQFLTTKIAISGQCLKNRLRKRISKIPLDTAVVIGICIGNNKAMEKQDPVQVATNIREIHTHIQEMKIPCFVMSLCPVLVNEGRNAPYSRCWSSVVNHHTAVVCSNNGIPFLPVDMHLFTQTNQGGVNVTAPNRRLVSSRGILGQQAKLTIGGEIIRFIDDSHSPTMEEDIKQNI